MPQGTTVVFLIAAQLLEAIMSIKDFVSLVVLVGVRINCVKPKSCNIDLNSQLSDVFKKLTLDNILRNTASTFECKNLDKSGGLYITKISKI